MGYIQAILHISDSIQREIAIAQLAESGFDTFEETDKLLLAYIEEGVLSQQELKDLVESYEVEFELKHIEKENWNETWERSFEPVKVGHFCTIRASFHQPDTDAVHEIIITPKMSFGTGHHATTRLMIEQMKDLDFTGKKVLDFGTGTGILAILAEKLGAAQVMANDTDEWSYENTIENIAFNSSAVIEVLKGSLEVVDGNTFDIILANINRHILLQYMKDMHQMLHDNGIVVMSGILVGDEALIIEQAQKTGLKKIKTNTHEQWISISFSKIYRSC